MGKEGEEKLRMKRTGKKKAGKEILSCVRGGNSKRQNFENKNWRER